MKLQIALIRCGCTDSGAQGRFLGREDEPLTEEGRTELLERVASGCYPAVELVYTGPAARAAETARLLYPRVPAVVLSGLAPFDYGGLEGKSPSELRGDPSFDEWARSGQLDAFPGGENPHVLTSRSGQALRQIAGEMSGKGLESTAVITHNAVITSIMRRYCIPRSAYRDFSAHYGCGYLLEFDTRLSAAKLSHAL